LAVSADYKIFIEELFRPLGNVKVRNLFGGAGVFVQLEHGDVMFALIASQTLYLKVDDTNRGDFEDEGMGAFVYGGNKSKEASMSYYEVPERLYDDAEEFTEWARKALDIAHLAKIKKPKKKAKGQKKPKP